MTCDPYANALSGRSPKTRIAGVSAFHPKTTFARTARKAPPYKQLRNDRIAQRSGKLQLGALASLVLQLSHCDLEERVPTIGGERVSEHYNQAILTELVTKGDNP